jgi:glycosyltransferase involved in cell wall biosynthesis
MRRALVCAPLPPEHDRESGSRRIHHFIEFLLHAGWSVAFVCENAPEGSRHLQRLRARGVPSFVGFDGATPGLIEAGEFDIAILAFWYLADRYGDLIRRLSPRTRIVVESVDLHWLREARGALMDPGGRLDEGMARNLVSEMNVYAFADRVTTVSEKEASLIDDILGRSGHARAIPDCDEVSRSRLGFDERRGVLFIGNFRHPPNLDAVHFLCHEVFPLLPERTRAEHPLRIVGNGLDGRVRQIAEECTEARPIGWVPTLEPYLHGARASVVPLRYGAGTKRKLIQSLMAGTPAVTTPIGVEGMDLIDGEHLLVGHDARSLADGLERLLTQPDLWHDLASRGRSRVLDMHGRDRAEQRFFEIMHTVLAHPARGSLPVDDGGGASLERFREAVADAAPEGASVLVVSRGDPELVRVPGLRCEHFPRHSQGGYAGFHPRDSEAAIRHLEQSVREGEYLVLPASSFWWLDYYPGFARHLSEHLEKVREDESCVVYRREARIREESAARGAGSREPVRRNGGA